MNIESTRISKFVTAFAVAALLPLAACTVETSAGPGETTPPAETTPAGPSDPVEPAEDPETPEPTVSETPESVESETPEPTISETPEPEETESWEPAGRLTREEVEPRVSRQLNCSDGVVEIDTYGFVTEITEDCDEVIVSGVGATILTQNIGTLTVDDTGNSIYVKDLGHVTIVEGADISYIVYEGATPTVDDNAIGSTIVHVDQADRMN